MTDRLNPTGRSKTLEQTNDAVSCWSAAARGRPEWVLWGKAQPGEDQPAPAHPLLCHMLDVALVARRMLEDVSPRAAVRRLTETMQLPWEHTLSWITFFVALHDLGKASPAFQVKAPPMWPALNAIGFDLDPPQNPRYHGAIGVQWIAEALHGCGVDRLASVRFARAVAAHHGQFPSNAEALDPASGREAGRHPAWSNARREIVTALARVLGTQHAPTPSTRAANDHAFILLVAGLTAVADWIGSMSEVFTYQFPPDALEEYLDTAALRADQALERAAMGPPFPGSTRSFAELFAGFGFGQPWPLHQTAERVCTELDGPALIIVEAPMGEGKTEAALLIAEHSAHRNGHSGFFVGLPTQATANQMLGRVERFLERAHSGIRANLQLAHGGAALVERYQCLIRGYTTLTTRAASAQSVGSSTRSVRCSLRMQ
jgi:CRISPR-associated endonuclease/helicase Cas3